MEDGKIVELLYVHDENGLKETKNKYDNLLNSLSYRIVGNKSDAYECVNDTYMKIWDSIPPEKPIYFQAFICKIIRQVSIDKYRYNHRKGRNSNNLVYLSDLDYEVKSNKNIEEEIQERLLIGTLNKFIDKLDVENKVLFIRKYFFFEDTKTLSKHYGLSETNINVKMLRIRNKLKKYLESEGYTIEDNR